MSVPLPPRIDVTSREFREFLEDKKRNIAVPAPIVIDSEDFRLFLRDAQIGPDGIRRSTKQLPPVGTDINSTAYRDYLEDL